ncbi:Maleylacetate reductase 1 [Fusarium oxysporum f. sp. albedinis]|nr:Maleylacetate reductase 1 [Fusarium oxysporum f. sp. albedinis]
MHERVSEGSILLSEVTSLTRARRLYDSLQGPCNFWVQSENKRCPEGSGPFVIDDKLGSLDKNGRKSSGDVSAQC